MFRKTPKNPKKNLDQPTLFLCLCLFSIQKGLKPRTSLEGWTYCCKIFILGHFFFIPEKSSSRDSEDREASWLLTGSSLDCKGRLLHSILFLEAASNHFELNLFFKVKKGQIHNVLIFKGITLGELVSYFSNLHLWSLCCILPLVAWWCERYILEYVRRFFKK